MASPLHSVRLAVLRRPKFASSAAERFLSVDAAEPPLRRTAVARLSALGRFSSLPKAFGSANFGSAFSKRSFCSAEPLNDDTIPPSQQSVNQKTASASDLLHKDDEHKEEIQRRRLSEVPIRDVLRAKHAYRWVDPVVPRTATLQEAMLTVIDGGLSGMMVLDPNKENHVVGLLTSRDLLRIMAGGVKEGNTPDEVMNRLVGDYMTPISQVIFGRPDETIGMCRTIMAKLGIKCLPILSKQGRVEGLLTARDMSDFGLSAKDKGGKTAFLQDVSERVGLSSDTSMADPPAFATRDNSAPGEGPLYVNIGEAMLPHPFKTADGVGRSQRDMQMPEVQDDTDLSEDAFFITTVSFPDDIDQTIRKFTYLGVADGVGSWREYGVDPRKFSSTLMQESRNILEEACAEAGGSMKESDKFRHILSPAQVMAQAYERVKAKNIIGSCTACIALFDSIRRQLHFSNLGDSGLIVLRHIDSEIAGTLKRDRVKKRHERKSDLQVSFVSQQQLRSFNHPFQLGWTGEEIPEGEHSSFKSARESCSTSVHVRRGDIIILATDGLFDNVDIDDISEIALDWEQRNGFIRGGDMEARFHRWSMGNSMTIVSAEVVSELASALCQRARENSLNNEIDSPFAILAKENDVMWSGGMPDDCTVLAIHVVGRDVDDTMDSTHM